MVIQLSWSNWLTCWRSSTFFSCASSNILCLSTNYFCNSAIREIMMASWASISFEVGEGGDNNLLTGEGLGGVSSVDLKGSSHRQVMQKIEYKYKLGGLCAFRTWISSLLLCWTMRYQFTSCPSQIWMVTTTYFCSIFPSSSLNKNNYLQNQTTFSNGGESVQFPT